jgi:hypothetical protein
MKTLTERQALTIIAFWFRRYHRTGKHVRLREKSNVTFTGLCYPVKILRHMGMISFDTSRSILSKIGQWLLDRGIPVDSYAFPTTQENAGHRADIALALIERTTK